MKYHSLLKSKGMLSILGAVFLAWQAQLMHRFQHRARVTGWSSPTGFLLDLHACFYILIR
jgi:hypothetical protein